MTIKTESPGGVEPSVAEYTWDGSFVTVKCRDVARLDFRRGKVEGNGWNIVHFNLVKRMVKCLSIFMQREELEKRTGP